eukprot:c1630_g1_i1.p1 GENE.c1630_g1_i1~~c1630_g1_i1.p1  ORF type:complete len:346 (+),score=55.55 c1630_g1_i1:333-1370(+)
MPPCYVIRFNNETVSNRRHFYIHAKDTAPIVAFDANTALLEWNPTIQWTFCSILIPLAAAAEPRDLGDSNKELLLYILLEYALLADTADTAEEVYKLVSRLQDSTLDFFPFALENWDHISTHLQEFALVAKCADDAQAAYRLEWMISLHKQQVEIQPQVVEPQQSILPKFKFSYDTHKAHVPGNGWMERLHIRMQIGSWDCKTLYIRNHSPGLIQNPAFWKHLEDCLLDLRRHGKVRLIQDNQFVSGPITFSIAKTPKETKQYLIASVNPAIDLSRPVSGETTSASQSNSENLIHLMDNQNKVIGQIICDATQAPEIEEAVSKSQTIDDLVDATADCVKCIYIGE